MHLNAKDLTKQRFGRLVAIRPIEKRSKGHIAWECICDCGNIVVVASSRLRSGKTKSCGCLSKELSRARLIRLNEKGRGKNHPNWSGGRVKKGDYFVQLKPEHPGADCRGYIYEHRLIMEEKLGRFLRPGEVVHHIDGNPMNNAPENLDLFASKKKHLDYHHKLELIAEET
jgi:hypothetical protein